MQKGEPMGSPFAYSWRRALRALRAGGARTPVAGTARQKFGFASFSASGSGQQRWFPYDPPFE